MMLTGHRPNISKAEDTAVVREDGQRGCRPSSEFRKKKKNDGPASAMWRRGGQLGPTDLGTAEAGQHAVGIAAVL